MYNQDNLTKFNKTDRLAQSEMIAVLEPRWDSPGVNTGYDGPNPEQNLNSKLDSTTIYRFAKAGRC